MSDDDDDTVVTTLYASLDVAVFALQMIADKQGPDADAIARAALKLIRDRHPELLENPERFDAPETP